MARDGDLSIADSTRCRQAGSSNSSFSLDTINFSLFVAIIYISFNSVTMLAPRSLPLSLILGLAGSRQGGRT